MLPLLPYLVPFALPWMPCIELVGTEGQPELRVVLCEGGAVEANAVLSLQARMEDGDQRPKLDSDMRGLDLILQPGDATNDPLLERALQGLGPGAVCVTFGSFEGSYLAWPTNRILPEQGSLALVIRVLKARQLPQR